jgi:hypothetical protein
MAVSLQPLNSWATEHIARIHHEHNISAAWASVSSNELTSAVLMLSKNIASAGLWTSVSVHGFLTFIVHNTHKCMIFIGKKPGDHNCII